MAYAEARLALRDDGVVRVDDRLRSNDAVLICHA
jgi:hypothetical protein